MTSRPLRIAIVGSGPAGVYAAGHLLPHAGGTWLDGRLTKLTDRHVEVDVLDRLSTPWGLVRHGVAPDHLDKKGVTRVFESIATRPGFRFFGNIEVGKDVPHDELAELYDVTIYAIGAGSDAKLGIPGEGIGGSLAARQFVNWYNGHPEARDLAVDLSHERAVIFGNGNVSLDIARILAQPVVELKRSDIAQHALEALSRSAIREIVICGRRGPLQAAFNNPELEELGQLADVDVIVDAADLEKIDPAELARADASVKRRIETLRRYARKGKKAGSRRIVLRFFTSPVEFDGGDHLHSVALVTNRLLTDVAGQQTLVADASSRCHLEAGLALSSVGYFGSPIPGLPFDSRRGIIPNQGGRILQTDGTPLKGGYVTGWIKRGPSGIIGTNKKCARDTVRALLADLDQGLIDVTSSKPDAATVEALLRARTPQLVRYSGWLNIDREERERGMDSERPRIKITRRDELLRLGTLP